MDKPEEFLFNIGHDEDLGGYYVFLSRPEMRNIATYDHGLLFIMPVGFYPVSPVENLFGFDLDPGEARRVLLDKGFIEDLDLI